MFFSPLHCPSQLCPNPPQSPTSFFPSSPSSNFLQLSAFPRSGQIKMSAGGAFGGNRGAKPVPPEKGIFPLDHLHECDLEKKDYIACLKSSGHQSEKCRHFSKKYLECRMERNLMAKQDMSELGFGKGYEPDLSEESSAKDDEQHKPSSPGKTILA